MKSLISPHELLKKFYLRKKKKFPSYSLRAIARDMKISPSFVHSLFNGKKALPIERISEIALCLDMDELAVQQLKHSLLHFNYCSIVNNMEFKNEQQSSEIFETVSQNEYPILRHWYYLAIMDLIECSDFKEDPKWIAQRLGIKTKYVNTAIHELLQRKLVKREGDKLVKSEAMIRFPTRKSHPDVISFHRLMLKKASVILNYTKDTDFEKRLVVGMCMAINPEKIAQVKSMLNETLYKAAKMLNEGELKEVYYLNVNFFPLTMDSPSPASDRQEEHLFFQNNEKLPLGSNRKLIN